MKTKTSFLSWTTTPWTIPGNVALSVNSNLEYSLMEVQIENKKQCLIISKALVESVMKDVLYLTFRSYRQNLDLFWSLLKQTSLF